MAKSLNKKRIFGSKIALLATLVAVLATRQFFPEENIYHEWFELTGNALVGICVMGRVYATAFLGGFKNDRLIRHGVYSVMRNPLYFFSLLGITGIALMSNHLVVIIGLPVFFLVLYTRLIAREEAFLVEKFGAEYDAYRREVPALWPKISAYQAPETVEMAPHYLNKAFFDAIWWLAALPIIEVIEYVQDLPFFQIHLAT